MGEVQLSVNLDSDVTAADQVRRQVKRMVEQRRWWPGMRLATVRQIALDMEMNTNVVRRLCKALTAEGCLAERVGTGMYAVGRAPDASEQHSRVFNV